MNNLLPVANFYKKIPLVVQIIIGLILGIFAAIYFPQQLNFISIFGELFVKALKSVAPLLVLVLVTSAIASHKKGEKIGLKYLFVLYVISTLLAGALAVFASFLFDVSIPIPSDIKHSEVIPVSNIGNVIMNLLQNAVSNPVKALIDANYIAILVWAIALGLTFRKAECATKTVLNDLSSVVTDIVKIVIMFAPLGVMGLVFTSCTQDGGFSNLLSYGKLLIVLVGVMFFVALIANPLIVAIVTKKNPYPLVFNCLKSSAIQAFFTRSSAANIPVNMSLCDEYNVPRVMSSISIPLGATVNMAGAAITISIFTLATAFSLNINIDLGTAFLLCIVSALAACGTSGIAGGSLMLIPLACSLFGINNDISMYIVGIGMILGVIQDSCETALNSSTDALLTIAVHQKNQKVK